MGLRTHRLGLAVASVLSLCAASLQAQVNVTPREREQQPVRQTLHHRSAPASATYTISGLRWLPGHPTLSLAECTYTSAQMVTLTDSTPGALEPAAAEQS